MTLERSGLSYIIQNNSRNNVTTFSTDVQKKKTMEDPVKFNILLKKIRISRDVNFYREHN